jgi:hypothetical protein
MVAIDESGPRRQFEHILDQYAGDAALIEGNYWNARGKHQWKNRIRQMGKLLGEPV